MKKPQIYGNKVSNCTCPRIYSLPNVHKLSNKMRSITNFINSLTYKLGKWVTNRFQQLSKFENNSIKISFELIEKLKMKREMKQEKNYILILYDVATLFPSVPQNTTSHRRMVKNNISGTQNNKRIHLNLKTMY